MDTQVKKNIMNNKTYSKYQKVKKNKSGKTLHQQQDTQINNKSGENEPIKFKLTLPQNTINNIKPQQIQQTQLQTQKNEIKQQPVLIKEQVEIKHLITPINNIVNSPIMSDINNSVLPLEKVMNTEQEINIHINSSFNEPMQSYMPYDLQYVQELQYSYNKYYSKIIMINMFKQYVFLYKALICGRFNVHYIKLKDYISEFYNAIKHYEIINNINCSYDQINHLFTNKHFSPETIKRMELPENMDILITQECVQQFLNNIKIIFDTHNINNTFNTNYKIEYINKGYIDNIDINIHNGNKLSLFVVKITEPVYNNIFELHFIVFENEKTKTEPSYIIDLHIPYGLYSAEHFYITNNGYNAYNIQYTNSSLDEISYKINNNIISLFPKYNDNNYIQLSKYVNNLFKKLNNSNYMFEFDIFNKTHSKSDFMLTNKEIVSNDNNSFNYCNNCNFKIYKNNKYVIAKCCNKAYHIECMDFHYYQPYNSHSYLSCDCGFYKIDENACNSKLLHALYIHCY